MAPMLETPHTCQPASRARQSSAWDTAGSRPKTPSQTTITPIRRAASIRRSISPRRTGGSHRVPSLVQAMPYADGPAKTVTSYIGRDNAVEQPAADARRIRLETLAHGDNHLDDVQTGNRQAKSVTEDRSKPGVGHC